MKYSAELQTWLQSPVDNFTYLLGVLLLVLVVVLSCWLCGYGLTTGQGY